MDEFPLVCLLGPEFPFTHGAKVLYGLYNFFCTAVEVTVTATVRTGVHWQQAQLQKPRCPKHNLSNTLTPLCLTPIGLSPGTVC